MRRNLTFLTFLTFLVLLGSLAGCGHSDEGAEFTRTVAGEEILRITNNEDEVDLVLTTDAVYMELSAQVLDEIHQELEKEREEKEDSEFASGIKNMVLDGVEQMMQTKVEYDLDEIREIRWDGGEMIFEVEGSSYISFDAIEVDGDRPVLETFNRRDALEFIAEFYRVKGQII